MESIIKNEKTLKCGIVVGLNTNQKGFPSLQARKPKAKRLFANYYFKSEKNRYDYLKKMIINAKASQRAKIERAQSRKATPEKLATVNIGDIFVSSWGYEQTQVDFYQVIEKKGCFVIIRSIASESGEMTSLDSDTVKAVKDSFIEGSEPMRKKLSFYNSEPSITLNSFSYCGKWDGRARHRSWGY